MDQRKNLTMRRTSLISASVALCACLTACGGPDGPKCLESHTTVHTTTTLVNGKMATIVTPVTVCTKYEEKIDG